MFSKNTETFPIPIKAIKTIDCPLTKALFVDICLYYHQEIGNLKLKSAELLGSFNYINPEMVRKCLDNLLRLSYLKETSHGNFLINKEVL